MMVDTYARMLILSMQLLTTRHALNTTTDSYYQFNTIPVDHYCNVTILVPVSGIMLTTVDILIIEILFL